MRLHEFVNLTEDGGASSGTTCSGSIAPVVTSMGGVIARNAGSFFAGTNTSDEFPNTPYKKKKKSKFQNSL